MSSLKTYRFYVLLLFTGFLALQSCLKKEDPVPAPQPGSVNTVQIEIGYPYTYQVFYDCQSNTVVSTNTKYDWDLAFESAAQGYHIRLNYAKGVLAAPCGSGNFDSTYVPDLLNWRWDHSNGSLDSTAFGDWADSGTIYLVDLQYDALGTHLGYKKIQLLSVNDQQYQFRFANPDGTGETTYTLTKNSATNFTYFSFENGGATKTIEPPKDTWDLLFTNYQHKFSNLPLPFVITGVFTNRYDGVTATEDNANNFSNIILTDTANYIFTADQDEIGYDWKIRNSQDNSFTMEENKSFLVRSTEGRFYKIRFIDFYNETGTKGYPTFEIVQL